MGVISFSQIYNYLLLYLSLYTLFLFHRFKKKYELTKKDTLFKICIISFLVSNYFPWQNDNDNDNIFLTLVFFLYA